MTASPEIKREKWKKLLGNVALGAISAVTDLRSFEIMRIPELQEIVFRAVDEAAAVAKAEGVALDVAEARSVLMKLVDTSGGGTGNSKSSMREDIIRKRRTEIDTIHGAVARLARQHKIAAPTIDAMVAMVKGVQSTYLPHVRAHMDFALSEQQRLLVETVRRFVRTELMPLEKELEEKRALDPEKARDIFEKSKALGLYAVNIPAEYGGGGLSAVDTCLAEEQFGHTTDILIRRAFGNVYEVLLLANDAQRERWLEPSVRGERVFSVCFTEPEAGSDAAGIKTRATRDGDGWLLSGQKIFISDGAFSDFFVVSAVTDPAKGAKGISLFIVDKGMPGFTVGRDQPMMGLAGTSHIEMFFENVRLGPEHLLGQEGRGLNHAFETLGRIRLAQIGARAVGKATRILDLMTDHARERRQFGKPIGEQQLIQQLLADSGDRDQRGAADGAVGRARDRPGPRRARAHLDGEGLRRRNARPRGRPRRAGVRRHGLLQGSADRALLSRRAHLPHLRRHIGNPPHGDRALDAQARRRAVRRCHLSEAFMGVNKFVTAEAAAALIADGDTVALIGGGGGLCEATYLHEAIEKRFLETRHPRGLTVIHSLGIGDRKSRGMNRFAHEGMVKRVIGGHWVWSPRMQELARTEKIEAYVFPGGVAMQLFREIGAGRPGLFTHVGLGTFVDPRVEGGRMNKSAKDDLIEVVTIDGKELLRYKSFPVNVAVIKGSFADAHGNISLDQEPANVDIYAAALAAHNSGGKVIAQVRTAVEAGALPARSVRVPGAIVDAVVVDPEQRMGYDVVYDPTMSGEIKGPPKP